MVVLTVTCVARLMREVKTTEDRGKGRGKSLANIKFLTTHTPNEKECPLLAEAVNLAGEVPREEEKCVDGDLLHLSTDSPEMRAVRKSNDGFGPGQT